MSDQEIVKAGLLLTLHNNLDQHFVLEVSLTYTYLCSILYLFSKRLPLMSGLVSFHYSGSMSEEEISKARSYFARFVCLF